jgi:hypothetical protein
MQKLRQLSPLVRRKIMDLEEPIDQHALLTVSGDTERLHKVHLRIVQFQNLFAHLREIT